MAQFRKGRVDEEVRKELADMIQNDLKDPRLGFVSIIKADVATDFKTAKIYVSHLNDNEEIEESMKALKSASGYMRRELSKRLKLRTVPELIFMKDDSIVQGFKISQILADYDEQHKAHQEEN